jgi:hypothetical protein
MPEMISKLERENYLIRLQKEFSYAGAAIPGRLTLDGTEISLRAYVFEVSGKKGRLTPEEQAEVDRTATLLRKKRREIVESIAVRDVTREEAESLYQTAAGIDRALHTLYRAHEPRSSAEEEARKARIQDGQRWLSLVRKIYARDDQAGPSGHGGFR